MQVRSTTLNHLYQQLNPAHDRAVDQCELRADSLTSPLRVKTRKAFWTSVTGRTAHQGHAMAQVKDMLGNSIRARQPQADAADVSVQVNTIWSRHIGVRDVVHLHRVRLMNEDVRRLPRHPDDGKDRASVQWHGAGVTPARATSTAPAAASAPAPARAPAVPARTPARISNGASAHSAAPASPAAMTDAALFTTPPTARERMRRRAEATTRLKAACSPAATPTLPRSEREFFQRRLDDIVSLAASRSPELLDASGDGPAVLSGAAGRILSSRRQLMSTSLALYNELAARDPGRAERLMLSLSLAERAVLRQHLALEALPTGPVTPAR